MLKVLTLSTCFHCFGFNATFLSPYIHYRQELVASISAKNLIQKTMFCSKAIAFKKNNAVVHFARGALHNLTSFAEQNIQIRTKKSSQI